MAGSRSRSLTVTVVASLLLAFTARTVPARADTPETCSNVTLVLDESGSIDPYEGNVRTALNAFFNSLSGFGVSASIVEFGTAAKTVMTDVIIDSANITGTFAPYVDATGSGDVYDSPSQLGAYTNWDDALDEVSNMPTNSPLVLFMTDGDPTAYNLDATGEPGGVVTGGVTTEATVRAEAEADEITSQGSHIIAVGVGAALTNSNSVDRLKGVAGPDTYPGDGPLNLTTTDVVLVPDFGDLPSAMALIAQAMCADPAISIDKSVNLASVVVGTSVTYTIEVNNTGNVALSNVEVTDPAVPSCSTNVGSLDVGESASFTCTTTLWGPLTNTATASGEDPFGTPVEDDDSAIVSIIATGTGTPGYWKNHPEVWPMIDDGILLGDWNHNWTCDSGETCLALTFEEAMAALSTPPKGDMTWNLARALVAAWLNVSAGNEASCIASTIDSATAWLATYGLGGGVKGGDPAWSTASVWASTLDDYNNGRLCAEHRDDKSPDSGETEVSTATATTTTTVSHEPDADATSTARSNGKGANHGKGRGKNKK